MTWSALYTYNVVYMVLNNGVKHHNPIQFNPSNDIEMGQILKKIIVLRVVLFL